MLSWQSTYANMPLMPVKQPDPSVPPKIDCESNLDIETLLPMELIRVHTKTEDIPSSTDEQLALYRKASVESAEQYTGIVIDKLKPITEILELTFNSRTYKRGYVLYSLQHPVTDGLVYLYGNGKTQMIKIAPRSRKIRVPIGTASLDLSSSCCREPCDRDPCGSNGGMFLTVNALYNTGFKSNEDVPAGIVLGCLKYIAWCVTHPGDEILAVRNRTITRSSLVDGTNNVAWASGAIEIWRQYDPEQI